MISVASPRHPPPLPVHYRPMPHREAEVPSSLPSKAQGAQVAQALEIARESADGAANPTVSKILEHAITHIWGKVQAAPDSYVMTRDEFSVFNYFQGRFYGNQDAVDARKRYWDNMRA